MITFNCKLMLFVFPLLILITANNVLANDGEIDKLIMALDDEVWSARDAATKRLINIALSGSDFKKLVSAYNSEGSTPEQLMRLRMVISERLNNHPLKAGGFV